MVALLKIDDFDNFKMVRDCPATGVQQRVIESIRNLDEREELEPFIRSILFDSSNTPHGPAEIVDILTHKVDISGKPKFAGFILKGKSFPTVRSFHVSHQIYRLEKISGLGCAVLATTGTVLDAAKEQFVSTAKRLKITYSIFDAIDLARLFIAYGFFCPRDGNRIIAGKCVCGYAPKMKMLNILQEEALKALNDSHRIGQKAGLIVLPTGSGKTRIAVEDSKLVGAKKILYVAHTQEILDVAESEFESAYGKDKITRHLTLKTLNTPNVVNIATIQLLRKNIDKIDASNIDYVVIDEFHHAAASSYRKMLEIVNPSYLLGLTATPFRGDRQDIFELCDGNLLVSYELRSGIDNGILCPYHYFGCFDDIDYSKIAHNGIQYSVRDLEKALIIEERDKAILKKWKEYAENKPTLAFCVSHAHAKRVARSFNKMKIPAKVYLATTTTEERASLISDLSLGRVKVLCIVDVLNEGADLPFVECLLFLRPTESKRIFFQQLGRGLRKYIGKSHCTVIDFIGNFKNAYKVLEYQGLNPYEGNEPSSELGNIRNVKDLLNLPLGCKVNFDQKVIDVFSSQTLDPRNATRHNIGRILIYQYQKLSRKIGHNASRKEVDRNLLLDSSFYRMVFGHWQNFERILRN